MMYGKKPLEPLSRARRERILIVVALGLVALSFAARAVNLDGVVITLESSRYYSFWDLTRLVYRVRGSSQPGNSSWALEAGQCVTDDVILSWASASFEWISHPFRGLRFERASSNQYFYLWLVGQWDVSSIGVASLSGDSGEPVLGEIDGPACAGASISLETVSGSSIAFPAFEGIGAYPADGDTLLRISSTSSGWSLTHATEFVLPDRASESIVERILNLTYDPFVAVAGATEVRVKYTMLVGEQDLAGLPEGTYVIRITYTASTD